MIVIPQLVLHTGHRPGCEASKDFHALSMGPACRAGPCGSVPSLCLDTPALLSSDTRGTIFGYGGSLDMLWQIDRRAILRRCRLCHGRGRLSIRQSPVAHTEMRPWWCSRRRCGRLLSLLCSGTVGGVGKGGNQNSDKYQNTDNDK